MAKKPTLKAAMTRVGKVEARVGVPHEIQDLMDRLTSKGKTPKTTATRVLTSFPQLKGEVSVKVELVELVFDLDAAATNAQLTRVYLPGSDTDIASSASPHGVLPRQISGSTVCVVMETLGNPGQTGKFTVQGALQPSITLKAEDSPSIKVLIVS
jgi:hypothetical protein